jgi:hypothetical protein
MNLSSRFFTDGSIVTDYKEKLFHIKSIYLKSVVEMGFLVKCKFIL